MTTPARRITDVMIIKQKMTFLLAQKKVWPVYLPEDQLFESPTSGIVV